MNIKPKLGKVIICALIWIILVFLIRMNLEIIGADTSGLFIIALIEGFIIAIIVYFIWSFFEKNTRNQQSRNKKKK